MSERYTPTPEEQQPKPTKISRRQFIKHTAAATASTLAANSGQARKASSEEVAPPNFEEFINKVTDQSIPESEPTSTPIESPISQDELQDLMRQALQDENYEPQEGGPISDSRDTRIGDEPRALSADTIKNTVQPEELLPNINPNQEWASFDWEKGQLALAVASALIEIASSKLHDKTEPRDEASNSVAKYPTWLERHRNRDKSTNVPATEISHAIQTILTLPAEKKQAALATLREAYLDKIHHQGLLYNEMLEMVKTQPDISAEELKSYLASEAHRLGIEYWKSDLGLYVIDKFTEHRAQIKEVIDRQFSPEQLYEQITSSPPEGVVEVDYHYPFCINIKLYSQVDYARFFYTNTQHKSSPNEVTAQDIQAVDAVFGFYHINSIYTATRMYNHSDQINVESVQSHEQQHAINDVVNAFFDASVTENLLRSNTAIEDLRQALDSPDNADALPSFSKYLYKSLKYLYQAYIYPQAKDEILAQYRGTEHFKSNNLYNTMMKSYAASKYIYYDTRYNQLAEAQARDLKELLLQLPSMPNPQEILNGELSTIETLENDYNKLVYASSLTISGLEGLGYQKDEIISILSLEDLNRWPALFRRLVTVLIANEQERKDILDKHKT